MTKAIALYVSVTLLVSFLTLVGGACFVIWKVAKQDTFPLERSLIHTCKTKKLQGSTESTSEPLQNESSDCSLMIKTSHSSGFWNSKKTEDRIFTSTPIALLNMDGLPQRGIRLLTADVLNTPKLEQVSRVLDLERQDYLSMPLNIAQSETKKPCQTCIKIRKALGVGGA